MADTALSTRGLRKTYRSITGQRTVGVASLDLDVPIGGVHGFLGPNGSGKTTTIRMALGLIRPDSGHITMFGRAVPDHLPEVINRVGAIVERPQFFPNMSVRKNLILLAEAVGVPEKRVDEVLDNVGLRARSRDPYRVYSLGMKQRVAIAATLLKDPDLFIFDEPTNGLDPAGIREVRDTMRELADAGKTVLVSSHVLAEVQQVADTVSIIGRGVLLASGTVAELTDNGNVVVKVGVADRSAAAELLRAAGADVVADDNYLLVERVESAAQVTRILADGGHYVHEISRIEHNLESVFLELTKDQGPGAPVLDGLVRGGSAASAGAEEVGP